MSPAVYDATANISDEELFADLMKMAQPLNTTVQQQHAMLDICTQTLVHNWPRCTHSVG